MSLPSTIVYVPGAMSIIDFMLPRDGGELRGGYSGETLEQIRARYPGAIIGELDTFTAEKEARLRTDPVEITRDQWTEALEVLPPLDHQYDGRACTFKCMEMLSGRITSVYCRIGSRCFTFTDVASIPHAEIVAKCQKVIDN